MLSCFCFSGGVNSTALALEIAQGNYRAPDIAMNLPTDADDATTRNGIELAQDILRSCRIPIIRMKQANILHHEAAQIATAKHGLINYKPLCPFWNLSLGNPRRQLRRQCTRHWKARPMRAVLRQLAGIHTRAGHVRAPIAEFWLGFSADEPLRCRQPGPRWLRHRFPLYELGHSRADCRAILDAAGEHMIIRSACLHCPYRADADWAAMRHHNPMAYATAISLDQNLRHAAPRLGPLYLHRSCRPLAQAIEEFRDPDPNHRGT